MVCMIALTGCRRSEMCRSLIDDWDLAYHHIDIREKKKDTTIEFTIIKTCIHKICVNC